MNKTISNHIKVLMKLQISFCTPEEQMVFKRMYSHLDLEKPINDVIEAMSDDKLINAYDQIERTVNKKPVPEVIPTFLKQYNG